MVEPAGQRGGDQAITISYRAEIYATGEGDEVRLDRGGNGSSIGELAEDLIAQAAELTAEAHEKLRQAETERDEEQQTAHEKELSGRRRRSWE